jgi:predicted nucleotidyltransferase
LTPILTRVLTRGGRKGYAGEEKDAHLAQIALVIRPGCWLEEASPAGYAPGVSKVNRILSLAELRRRFRSFCVKYRIRRLEVFGSAAHGDVRDGSDVDLLVTLEENTPVSTSEVLEMAGEAEELVGRPVDFVLRPALEKSSNRFAREHILSTAVCLYGS